MSNFTKRPFTVFYQHAFKMARMPLARPMDTLSPSAGERDGVRGSLCLVEGKSVLAASRRWLPHFRVSLYLLGGLVLGVILSPPNARNQSVSVAPANPAPLSLSITNSGPDQFLITWNAISNVTYRVCYSSNLVSGSWTALVPDVTATGTTASVVEDAGGVSQRFYQVLMPRFDAGIVLTNLNQIYDGTRKNATAITTPAGLPVQLNYDGQAVPPTYAGSYQVVATVINPNYMGAATNTLVIAKAPVNVVTRNFVAANMQMTNLLPVPQQDWRLLYVDSQELIGGSWGRPRRPAPPSTGTPTPSGTRNGMSRSRRCRTNCGSIWADRWRALPSFPARMACLMGALRVMSFT